MMLAVLLWKDGEKKILVSPDYAEETL